MMLSDAEKLAAIRAYVLGERERRGIVTGRVPLPELSCEAVGEFYNLVKRQLVNTEEGYGAWRELEYPPVLEGAYRYVTEGI